MEKVKRCTESLSVSQFLKYPLDLLATEIFHQGTLPGKESSNNHLVASPPLAPGATKTWQQRMMVKTICQFCRVSWIQPSLTHLYSWYPLKLGLPPIVMNISITPWWWPQTSRLFLNIHYSTCKPILELSNFSWWAPSPPREDLQDLCSVTCSEGWYWVLRCNSCLRGW